MLLPDLQRLPLVSDWLTVDIDCERIAALGIGKRLGHDQPMQRNRRMMGLRQLVMRARQRFERDAVIHLRSRQENASKFPLLAGPFAPFVFTGNLTANLMRNVWSYMIIFCGHFPDGTQVFTVEETQGESRGMWYFRQILGSATLTGGKLFHLLSGHLSHQIEHHLFPDMPAQRYSEIAAEVQEICRRYGVPYNAGSLPKQFGTVVRKIVKLALPPTGRGVNTKPKDRERVAA